MINLIDVEARPTEIMTEIMTEPMMSDDACWQAVRARDARYDGAFVTCVLTTGIYCRPSCPARAAKRENVIFLRGPQEAEAAGFRACKRCRPEAVSYEAEMVERVCRYIETNLGCDVSLQALGTHVGYSPYHLQRVFKRVLGVSPRQYAEAARLGRLKTELKEAGNVMDAIYNAGFNSSSAVYDGTTTRALGMDPSTYRRGGAGVKIGYTIVDSPLGRLLIAATDCGIAGLSFADTDATLETYLREEFPNAEVYHDDLKLRSWVEGVLDVLDGEGPTVELPLDVRATAFQWRVWDALRAIPRGETRSYGQIARALGKPTAARAVARACATNPVALIIPCHRVVREDGGMGGYRWGLKRKEALLAAERGQLSVVSHQVSAKRKS